MLAVGFMLSSCGGRSASVPPTMAEGHFATPAKISAAVPPPPPATTPLRPSSAGRRVAAQHASFFAGEQALNNGVYYLALPNGNVFGYYSYLPNSNYIYHFDIGYLYVLDANDNKGGVYLYDFTSGHWWYTGRQYPFPYVYDFSLSALLYYFPDGKRPQHYTTAPRYFYDFAISKIVIVPADTGPGTPLNGPALGGAHGFGGWTPTSVATTLNFPVQSGFDGSGNTVAIIIDSYVDPNDISAYLSYNHTPSTSRTIQPVYVNGALPVLDTSNNGESTLDVETVAGLAPGANILVYVISQLSTQAIVDGINQVSTDGKASIVSMSFGGCEHPGFEQDSEHALFQAASNNGIAYIASSGDQGNECFTGQSGNQYQVGVSYPASDPSVIAVGGTETSEAQTLSTTSAWNDTLFKSQMASGGGVSAFPIPAYQQGLSGVASTQFRNVPDIALPATEDALYLNGTWFHAAGTSWSSPMFAAMLAEVYQYCNASFTNAVAAPYTAFQRNGYNAFVDITTGNNGFASSTPSYAAQTGYDNVTGLGEPLGMQFAQTLCPNRVPAARVRVPQSVAMTTRGPEGPISADLTPKVSGLLDRGRRDAQAATRIQLVLRPTASVAADEQTVVGVLQTAGLQIVRRFPNHLVVDASGPSAAVEQLFATQMHDVVQGSYGVRYTPMTAGAIPATLAPYVAGISLDDVITHFHPHPIAN